MIINTFTAAAARLSKQTTKSMSFSFRCLSYSFMIASHSLQSLTVQDLTDRGDDGIAANIHTCEPSISEVDPCDVLAFLVLLYFEIEDLCITLIEGAHKLLKCEISSRFKVSSLFFLQFFVCHFSQYQSAYDRILKELSRRPNTTGSPYPTRR